MKLKAGDYIELEGVSEEGLKQVRDAFVEAGFEEAESLERRGDCTFYGDYTLYGVGTYDNKLWFFNERTVCSHSPSPRLLTIDQVLSTNIEVVQTIENAQAEDEEFARIEKQARYTSENGKDLIDRWAERYTADEFRLIMLAMIEKYMTRMGRKDSIAQECRKIADYANRLALVEEARG